MSQIFDALQRAEAERSGNGAETPLVATEVLQRAERLASSEWEKEGSTVEMRRPDAAKRGAGSALHAAVAGVSEFGASAPGRPPSEEQVGRTLQAVKEVELNLPEETRLVCVTDPDSPSAEAFRLLGVRLRDLRQDRVLRKILITSTIPQEGKSTVSANLACMLAQTGKERVLLLEGDVRRPSQSKLFGLESLPGMCEWLQGGAELTQCIYRLKSTGLWILPAGAASHHAADLLQPGKVSSLLERLEEWFDTIVIDSPPVLPLADTSVWTRVADGILLVTREGVTEKRQLIKGLEALDREKLIGALLNGSLHNGHAYYYY